MASRLAPYALIFALAWGQCLAQNRDTTYLEELTWTELRDQVRAGKTTVIIPIGGTEQNGPHMVLGKHNVRVKALSAQIASRLGDALVAPVIAHVPEGNVNAPSAHLRFPGTLTVPEGTFEKLLESTARSLKLHGFRDIVFLADHGDYLRNVRAVSERLNREWRGEPVRAHAIEEYYRAATSGFAQLLKDKGYAEAEIGTHAGLADTSLALAVDQGLVRADRLQSQAKPGIADGVTGDPRRASAELGRLGVELIVERSTQAIRKARERR